MNLIKHLDNNLLDLAWSLWTELGVRGVIQNHQNVLILVEELVILTSVLSEIDPRLRDESLDWCSQFHHFISVDRLKNLMKDFGELAREPFSKYASNLNGAVQTNWPVLSEMAPMKIRLSGKSVLRAHESPALLNIRARSIFKTGARADILTFFLVHPNIDFSVAEIAAIGYSKRNVAEILDDLHLGKLLDRYMQGNQQRYRLTKNSALFEMLKPIPKFDFSWHLAFKVLLAMRSCLHRVENYSESTKVIELSSCLKGFEGELFRLGVEVPVLHGDFTKYLAEIGAWIIGWSEKVAKGRF